MKKSICILTATRAEYGLVNPIIKKLTSNPNFDVRVVVTGAHLSPEFGLTYKEIENDGIVIDEKIEMLLSSDTPSGISKSMGMAMIGFGEYFSRTTPDLLIVLGDRYETLAVCCAAMNHKIPIAHLHGGEITQGAVDDAIRHAITKLSYLHFTSTQEYRNRVIQLGEQPDRVFCVGAIGIENILRKTLLSKAELEKSIDYKLNKRYAMVTFHPVTLDNTSSKQQVKELLNACETCSNVQFVFTKANADASGRIINNMIDLFVEQNENAIAFTSLGSKRYLSALKYCTFVIGNSSSGLVEAPSFGIPTINIGDRQKGRLQATSVINCEPLKNDIINAMDKAMSDEFINIANNAVNPYGDGKTSEKILDIIIDYTENDKIDLMKTFYDL